MIRYRLEITGIVQGVGFRPFVYALATELGLAGLVYNSPAGVTVEIEGAVLPAQEFLRRLPQETPPLARIASLQSVEIPALGESRFRIVASQAGERRTLVAADMAICADCRRELFDPADRRYRYPFINCTNCGPRFTIIEDLPYDRPLTTMADFPLCAACRAEYEDPRNRRFHAQPNACALCGPRLCYHDAAGEPQPGEPLESAQALLQAGGILALKGLGGYHLACSAFDAAAVARLRAGKIRWAKPFAVMCASLAQAAEYCQISAAEADLLQSPQRPILLLVKKPQAAALAPDIAPGNGRLGLMLPYTPLHDLLLANLPPLVMTSGNRAEEPIAHTEAEAFSHLSGIADGFLTHNRRIFRRADDSVAIFAAGAPRLLRRSRGYAPEPLPLPGNRRNLLAVGGEQKNTFCLARQEQAFLSQHIGDLNNRATEEFWRQQEADFRRLFQAEPEIIVHDLHPDYLSTKLALAYRPQLPHLAVQHHHAHLAGVLAEQGVRDQALGLIFDGTGYGPDGCLWGGELLLGDCRAYRRLAHLAYAPLPGGEQAVREPWRMALSYLRLTLGEAEFAALPFAATLPAAWRLLWQSVEQGLNAPQSSGLGRLFDGVAALLGLGATVDYEGQAAIALEQAVDPAETGTYRLAIDAAGEPWQIDWRGLFRAILADLAADISVGRIASRFHHGLAQLCLELCSLARQQTAVAQVALAGGCWQNVFLLEETVSLLRADGFRVLLNEKLPMNDGGLAYGQAAVASASAGL